MDIVKDFPEGIALVVGGSGGAGMSICEELARAGSDVALTYRSNKDNAMVAEKKVQQLGQQAQAYAMSIGDAAQVESVVRQITAEARLHTVVVAAGSDIDQVMIRDMSAKQWQDVIDADLGGFFNVVRATLPALKAGGGGSYVHISSAGLQKWPPRDVLSVAPKAAIESLIQGIAKEEGEFNIRANSVLLGVIETGIFLRLLKDGTFGDDWIKATQSMLALRRWGKPEEIAHAVVYLASQRAGYVTGQTISVDGGYGI
jgi:NAD(P)-dependent dehydrogenase (short-subunit alcohol dehydrogenase family)